MQILSRSISVMLKSTIVCLALFLMTGCQLLPHSLQPSQWHKLNRGPKLGRDTYNFSIKDPTIPSQEKYYNGENSEAMNRALSDRYDGFNL